MYYTCALLLATCGVTLSPDLPLQDVAWNTGCDDPHARVDCVASDRVEVSWCRSGSWSDITDFSVSIIDGELQDDECADNVTCNTAVCSFNSRECALQPCTLYNLTVTGGDMESEDSFTTAPAPPSSVNVSVSYRSVRVSWSGHLGECHNRTVVTVTTPHTRYKQNLTSAMSNGHYDQDLVACDTGQVVASVQVVGGDGQADEVSGTQNFSGEDAGSIVTNLELLPGSRSIQASWSVKSNCARMTGYQVTWTPKDSEESSFNTTGNTTLSYTILNLSSCTEYTITVQPLEGNEFFTQPAVNTSLTEDEAPPAPAQITCKTPESSSSLTVTWVYPDTKCQLTKYLVVYSGVVLWSNNTYNGTNERPPSQSSYVDLNDLTPWTTYTVCVAGVISGDLVGATSCCVTTTLEAKPSAPEALEVVSISTSAISLSWDPPSQPNGQVTEYQLTLGSGAHVIINTTTCTLTGLYAGTHYNVTLQARNGAGWGQVAWKVVETDTTVVGIVVGVVLGLAVVVVVVTVIVYRDTLLKVIRKKTVLRPSSVEMSVSRVGATSDGEIKKCDLWSYIRNLESDTQRGLEEEFAQVKSQSPRYSTDAATRHINKEKNRFVDTLPYDHSRVELPMVPGQFDSDYINASYIKDIHGRLFFVAAQGPKPETVGDFWRMVWELGIETVVMLTNLTERGREKCAQYWPSVEESRAAHDGYLLRIQAEEKDVHFTTRIIEVTKGYQKRLVKQYHFTTWPDFGAPSHEDHLLNFITSIRTTTSAIGNHLLTHCSAGVGRTGTFIGLWNLMDMVDANTHAPTINIKRVVLEMRETRPSMVQSQEQYLYLYKCIAAYLESSVMEAQEVNHVYDNPGYEEPIYMNT